MDPNETSFMNRLLRSFLNRNEIKQYLIKIFSPILNKLYEYTGISSDSKDDFLINLLEKKLYQKNKEAEGFVSKSKSKEIINPIKSDKAITFCKILLNDILESLRFMPRSVRYLLKIIEECLSNILKVLMHIIIDG